MRDGPRGFTQDFSCPALLRCRLAATPVFAYGAVTRCGPPFQRVRLTFVTRFIGGPTTPGRASPRAGFGLLRFRSPLLAQSLLFSSPPGSEMFQFPGFASRTKRDAGRRPAGCPIRKSAHQRVFAPPRGLSQLVTSFVASESQGILHAPFSPFLLSRLINLRRHIPTKGL